MPEPPSPCTWAQRAQELDPPSGLDGLRLDGLDRLGLDSEKAGDFDLAVKASTAVRGFAWHAGCPLFADQIAQADASIVATLRAHGARVVGTTNMHEMAMGITSANGWLGPVPNPVDPARSAGGSSGGSAAVVARGEVPLALGGDTAGSVSIPASVCGVVGFRPTVGRYPRDGHLAMSWTRDTPGLFARRVAEIATADRWITAAAHQGATRNADLGPGPRRLAVPVDYLMDLHPSTRDAWDRARSALEVEWDLVEVSFDALRPLLAGPSWTLIGWECRILFAQFAAQALGVAPDEGWQRLLDGIVTEDVIESLHRADAHPVTADVYAQAVQRTFAARAEYERVLGAAGCELAVFPTTVRPATRLGDNEIVTHAGEQMHVFALMTRNVAAGTMLRAPMLTLPVPGAAGALPVGITVQGRAFGDATVLAAGARLEASLRSA